MAEMETTNRRKEGRRFSTGSKKSTKVDLTPMVDLGFLLITFFIFTTSLAQPVAMKLNLPDDTPTHNPNQVSAEKTITLVLDDSRVFYYAGFFNGNFLSVDYDKLREVLLEKKGEVFNNFHKNSLTVVIKPSRESNYKNVVNILDEMVINDINTYVLDELNKDELEELKSYK